jgi:hypothetical protein
LSLTVSFVSSSQVLGQSDPEISLDMQDAPLVYVLEAIAALNGHQIVVKGKTQEYRVSVVLEHDNLQQNLKRALHGLNHILVWGADEKLTVWISGPGDDSPGAYTGDVIEPTPVSATPASLFPDSPPVVPPDEPGERGHTKADVAYYRSIEAPLDLALLAVVPTDEEGSSTVTQADIQRITQSEISLGPQSLVLPPDVPGEKGVTLEELELIREQNEAPLDPALLAVVPTDEDGPGIVSQADIERIAQSEIPLGPQSLVLPPDVPGEKGVTFEELELIRGQNNEDLDLSPRDNVVPPD